LSLTEADDIQPSELAPSSSALLAELIPKYLDPEGYAVVLGAVDQTTQLLEKQWGHSELPFPLAELTSSPLYWIWKGRKDCSCRCCQDFDSHYFGGKLASPSTDSQAYWQLGGKSPTIVAADANMRLTARRMMSIKPMSGSQICGELFPDEDRGAELTGSVARLHPSRPREA
jgi:aldehyde dehydrogenase (NAD+)